MIHGYSTPTGYLALSLDRVWTYLHATLGIEPPALLNAIPSNEIYHHGPFAYRSMSLVVGYDRRARSGVFTQNPDPRAYLTTAALAVRDWREAVARMRAGHDFHRTALVERPVAAVPPLSPPPPPGHAADATTSQPCRATIVQFAPERIVVETACSAPALLVLAEPWYPGWTATIDDVPAGPCLPANAWMRAVPVPAGSHAVVLTFRSTHLRLGALLSVGGLALAAAAGLRCKARRRRQRV